ncbi:hypothetical protein FQN57_006355 [Myotisia sp. PD_48]|nr:hypothetical protein FQN57_006355 [Myotisia sp. PD_48]
MGATGAVQTLFFPAIISLTLYIAIVFAILPFIRRYRQRYSQYLPLNTISSRTSSLRERALDALMQFVLPSSWRHRAELAAQEESDSLFEDGELDYELELTGRETPELETGFGVNRGNEADRSIRDA